MVQHFDFDARTAGQKQTNTLGYHSVQSWKSQSAKTIQTTQTHNFKAALSQAIEEPRTVKSLASAHHSKNPDSYKFDDVIDVINPLHHIPVLGMVYRELSGDTIKPASQIIGGGLFGGPIGAISGTINAIAQIQTGKDVTGSVLTMAGISPDTQRKQAHINMNDPESRLNAVAHAMGSDQGKGSITRDDLPSTAAPFASLPEVGRRFTKTQLADGRTAGNMIVQQQVAAYENISFGQNKAAPVIDKIDLAFDVPARERITEISLSPMPARQSF
ncbi:MAG: hypothetical protein GW903_06245 [Alphaproteobacteria bacterium]|nr:hypothetical protein [Alphaproteobacteria bacterium]NCQ88481.1 hypothetical protein [Alphaproteobacteria bacterium]NCT06024.1 hypothetical protein [Alphaproteobacteria bacterium]